MKIFYVFSLAELWNLLCAQNLKQSNIKTLITFKILLCVRFCVHRCLNNF